MAPTRTAVAALLLGCLSAVARGAPVASVSPAEPEAATGTLTAAAPPASFDADPSIGPGGSTYADSAHFRVYGAPSTSQSKAALAMLEAAYSCFVDGLGWRSSGLSFNDDSDDDGPWTKINVYSVAELPGAAGVMHSDAGTGMAWLEVQNAYISEPGVTVHEYGHGLTYHEKAWVDQTVTGAWWETVANWVADTYKTSDLCAAAREAQGQPTGATEISVTKVIGDSFQVIVDGSADSGNYYEAWPFLTYLTANPDGFSGLGQNTLREMFRQYDDGSNETPLHVLERLLAGSTTIQAVVGRYWARMAYADIGHPTAQSVFLSQRSQINYANLDTQSSGTYKVKSARQPRYFGASIVPLTKSGATTVEVQVTASSNKPFTATLAVRDTSTSETRYVDVSADGTGSVEVATGEEVALVVVNTPAALLQYDPFDLSSAVQAGLDYTVTISGATA